jgi:uncharacterized membrane protein
MGVLFNLIEQIEEKLGHSPHPAIVALPLGAWTVSAVCDVAGLLTRRPAYDDTARLSMGVGLVGAAGAIVTGFHDFTYIPLERPTHAIATTHATGMVAATSLLATSFFLRERAHWAGRRPSLTARALALGGSGLSLYAAYLGGVLVEEHGEGVKPVIRRQKKELERKQAGEQGPSAPPRETALAPGRVQE